MTKKILFCMCALIYANLFAEITHEISRQFTIGDHRIKKCISIVHFNSTSNQSRTVTLMTSYNHLPESISLEGQDYEEGYAVDDYLKKIIHYSDLSITSKIYNLRDKIIIEGSTLTSDSKFTIFSWTKKMSIQCSKLEQSICDYYQINKNEAVEFLYSYQKPELGPWAIKIGDTVHAIIWIKAESKTVPNNFNDSFLTLSPDQEKAKLEVLINENDQIIAKRIDGVATFKSR